MATAHHLTLTQLYDYVTSPSAIAGGSGAWNAKYYFTVGAVYGDDDSIDSMGFNHGVDFSVTASSNEILVGFSAPDRLPRYYRVFYIQSATAPDWDTDDWEMQDVIIPPYDTSITLHAPDPTGTTYILETDPPAVILNPVVDWTGSERQNLVITANGTHRQKSWAKPSLYSSVEFELTTGSCTPADYKRLQKWCRFAAPIKVEEPSSGFPSGSEPLYDYILGTITGIPQIYSWGKVNAPNWKLVLTVDEEVFL
jgi:hypothetical protein